MNFTNVGVAQPGFGPWKLHEKIISYRKNRQHLDLVDDNLDELENVAQIGPK